MRYLIVLISMLCSLQGISQSDSAYYVVPSVVFMFDSSGTFQNDAFDSADKYSDYDFNIIFVNQFEDQAELRLNSKTLFKGFLKTKRSTGVVPIKAITATLQKSRKNMLELRFPNDSRNIPVEVKYGYNYLYVWKLGRRFILQYRNEELYFE